MEKWKNVKGSNNYEVSSLGRVRKKDTKVICKCSVDRISGYMKCGLYENGVTITQMVHRMVAESFLNNPENKAQVHHINEDKADNRVENLMWVTPKEHGAIRSDESKRKFAETYRRNLERRKTLHTIAHQPVL